MRDTSASLDLRHQETNPGRGSLLAVMSTRSRSRARALSVKRACSPAKPRTPVRVGVDHEWLATRDELVDPKQGSCQQWPRVDIRSARAIVDDRGDNAVQVHNAFRHRAVDRSRWVIHDDPKAGITAEIAADNPLGVLLPTWGHWISVTDVSCRQSPRRASAGGRRRREDQLPRYRCSSTTAGQRSAPSVECDHLASGAEFGTGGIGDSPDGAMRGVAQVRRDVRWMEDRITAAVPCGVGGDGRGGQHHASRARTGGVEREDVQWDLVGGSRFGAVEHVDLMLEDDRPTGVDVLHKTRPKRLITHGMQRNLVAVVHLVRTSRRTGQGSHSG